MARSSSVLTLLSSAFAVPPSCGSHCLCSVPGLAPLPGWPVLIPDRSLSTRTMLLCALLQSLPWLASGGLSWSPRRPVSTALSSLASLVSPCTYCSAHSSWRSCLFSLGYIPLARSLSYLNEVLILPCPHICSADCGWRSGQKHPRSFGS